MVKIEDSYVHESLSLLVNNIGEDNIKNTFMKFMKPSNFKNILKNCSLVKEIYKKQKDELAQFCFREAILPLFYDTQSIIYIPDINYQYFIEDSLQKKALIFKGLFSTLKWLVNENKLTWNESVISLKNLILEAKAVNLEHNLEIMNVFRDLGEYEEALNCLNKNILKAFELSIEFRIIFQTNSLGIKILFKLIKTIKSIKNQEEKLERLVQNIIEKSESISFCNINYLKQILLELIQTEKEYRKLLIFAPWGIIVLIPIER